MIDGMATGTIPSCICIWNTGHECMIRNGRDRIEARLGLERIG